MRCLSLYLSFCLRFPSYKISLLLSYSHSFSLSFSFSYSIHYIAMNWRRWKFLHVLAVYIVMATKFVVVCVRVWVSVYFFFIWFIGIVCCERVFSLNTFRLARVFSVLFCCCFFCCCCYYYHGWWQRRKMKQQHLHYTKAAKSNRQTASAREKTKPREKRKRKENEAS